MIRVAPYSHDKDPHSLSRKGRQSLPRGPSVSVNSVGRKWPPELPLLRCLLSTETAPAQLSYAGPLDPAVHHTPRLLVYQHLITLLPGSAACSIPIPLFNLY